MEKILVPLDGSELAEKVLPYAKELATRLSGIIFLIRVVPSARQLAAAGIAGAGGIDGVSTVAIEAMDEAIALQMEEARVYLGREAWKLQWDGISAVWEVRQGSPAEEILEYAKATQIDLIAISSHGRSGLGRLVFGSVSDQVIRESGIPVLVIKHPKKDGESGSEGEEK